MASESDSDTSMKIQSETEDVEDLEATEEERLKIREELSTMSFEDLMKLKEKIGCKLYNKKLFGANEKKPLKEFKRANKNRPREISSKIKVKLDPLISRKKKVIPRDPRFDPLCGTFENKEFKKNYGFIKDVRLKEKKQLEKELKETTDDIRKSVIKSLLQRLDNQIREQEKQEMVSRKVYEEKREIKEKLKKGEKPQFKKKSTKRIESFMEQFEELKKQNKLDKHIHKRSKKLSRKELKGVGEHFAT